MGIKYTEDMQFKLDRIKESLDSLQTIMKDGTIHDLCFSIGEFYKLNPGIKFAKEVKAGKYDCVSDEEFEELRNNMEQVAELFNINGNGKLAPEIKADTKELYIHTISSLLEADKSLRKLYAIASIKYGYLEKPEKQKTEHFNKTDTETISGAPVTEKKEIVQEAAPADDEYITDESEDDYDESERAEDEAILSEDVSEYMVDENEEPPVPDAPLPPQL